MRLPSLLAAKAVVTDDLNHLFRMRDVLKNPLLQDPSPPVMKTIKPIEYFIPRPHPVDYVIGQIAPLAALMVRNLRRL
jgi:hypothetical protein